MEYISIYIQYARLGSVEMVALSIIKGRKKTSVALSVVMELYGSQTYLGTVIKSLSMHGNVLSL